MRGVSSVGRTVAVAVGLALTIGACGKTQDVSVGDPTPARLGAAAQAMAEAGTGTYSGTVSFTVGGGALALAAPAGAQVTVTMSMSGSYDVAGGRSTAHLEVSAIDGDVRAIDEDLVVGDEYDVVTDGESAYERTTVGGEAKRYDGAEWRVLDEARSSGELVPGIDADTFTVDPSGLFEQLQALSETVVDFGPATVGEAETRRFRAEVSMKKLAAMAQATMGTDDSGGPVGVQSDFTLPVDVYIDDEGFVRRYVTELDYGELMFGSTEQGFGVSPEYGSMTTDDDELVLVYRFELDFAGIGEPVTIDLPDGDTVGTEPEAKFEAVGEAIEVTPGTTSGTAMTAGTMP